MTPLDPFPPPAFETLLLVAAGIGLRLAGIRLRQAGSILARWPGWTASSFAPWLAASLFGAWSPLWVALTGGLAALAPATWAREQPRWPVAVDAVILLLSFGLSVGGPTIVAALLVGTVLAVGLAAFDGLVRQFGRPSGVTAALGLVPAVAFVVHVADFRQDPFVSPTDFPLHVGLVPRCFGVPVSLPGGAQAWLGLPGTGPDPGPARVGAVLYHGADSRGSLQPAACVLRRALQEAGLPVLALDHPGYGASAATAIDAPIEAWDYLPTARLAATWLVDQELAESVILVGHSMGSWSVLRLAADPPPEALGGIILGAAWGEENAAFDEDAYGRFHTDRHLTYRLDHDRWMEINRHYYDLHAIVDALPDNDFPIVDEFFAIDWPNIREYREELFAALPEPKRQLVLPSSHYLSSYVTRQLLVGNPWAARSFTRVVETLIQEWTDGEDPEKLAARPSNGTAGDHPAPGAGPGQPGDMW